MLDSPSDEDLRSIRALAFAMTDFEPFPAQILPARLLDRLTRESASGEFAATFHPGVILGA